MFQIQTSHLNKIEEFFSNFFEMVNKTKFLSWTFGMKTLPGIFTLSSQTYLFTFTLKKPSKCANAFLSIQDSPDLILFFLKKTPIFNKILNIFFLFLSNGQQNKFSLLDFQNENLPRHFDIVQSDLLIHFLFKETLKLCKYIFINTKDSPV